VSIQIYLASDDSRRVPPKEAPFLVHSDNRALFRRETEERNRGWLVGWLVRWLSIALDARALSLLDDVRPATERRSDGADQNLKKNKKIVESSRVGSLTPSERNDADEG